MRKIFNGNYLEWRKTLIKNKYKILLSFLFLFIAVVVTVLSGHYTTTKGMATSTDLFLDNFGPIDLHLIFSYGFYLVVGILILFPLFYDIKKFHLAISHFSLIIIIRSIFITLTHLKTPVDAIPPGFSGVLEIFVMQNDLFFSGHTAIPFIGFLVFHDSKIKYVFLALSILLGLTSLLMHRHYTIDVLSAFFIAYGTYKLGQWVFNKYNF
ncbi:hypothetical protein COU57_04605 [Candidatus Pacearchaeota archaeon CG10_big_fil_rev_8_21_14_0_10_32_14]|nr:MAG: hypothetical protein COU57_04605 [Candidatus Pacearchaeota archaeon CG10_big_fil_rev_8_21_14_0_10_32_14]